MPNVTLTTWERIKLSNVLGGLSGLNLAMLRKASKLLDKVELSESQKEEIEFMESTRPNGTIQFTWKEIKDWDLEFDKEELALLSNAVEQFNGWSVAEYEQAEALADKVAIK